MAVTVERFGRRSIIARHDGGCAFFSSSGRDYATNEINAREQLAALIRIKARAMGKPGISALLSP